MHYVLAANDGHKCQKARARPFEKLITQPAVARILQTTWPLQAPGGRADSMHAVVANYKPLARLASWPCTISYTLQCRQLQRSLGSGGRGSLARRPHRVQQAETQQTQALSYTHAERKSDREQELPRDFFSVHISIMTSRGLGNLIC